MAFFLSFLEKLNKRGRVKLRPLGTIIHNCFAFSWFFIGILFRKFHHGLKFQRQYRRYHAKCRYNRFCERMRPWRQTHHSIMPDSQIPDKCMNLLHTHSCSGYSFWCFAALRRPYSEHNHAAGGFQSVLSISSLNDYSSAFKLDIIWFCLDQKSSHHRLPFCPAAFCSRKNNTFQSQIAQMKSGSLVIPHNKSFLLPWAVSAESLYLYLRKNIFIYRAGSEYPDVPIIDFPG